ncbi:hypothetical protein [Paraburkholderia sp. SIMBA_054]|uniref:hypothetical protein n=1 Tax=Paraburkholderia sp. SIMBA_054 TaxID=3085795 RepID=UPI00397D56C5
MVLLVPLQISQCLNIEGLVTTMPKLPHLALTAAVAATLCVPSLPALAAVGADQPEAALVAAMRPSATKPMERGGDSGAAIRAYIAAGYLGKKPNARADYTDYWWLNKTAPFMGHDLVMIEEEYLSRWIGCCVSPGIGVTVRVSGNTVNLERFAKANRCSIDTNVNLREVAGLSHVALSSLPKGRYATMSCRERDIEQGQ